LLCRLGFGTIRERRAYQTGGETAGVTDADKLGRSGGIAAHFSSTHSTAVSADAQIA